MADDLKRVGLVLTAEGASEFQATLKGCQAAVKENKAELKLAQSQYNENTSVTQKLTDKQKYLSAQTETYKDKVALLQGQLKEMESNENADSTAIEKKKTELAETQATLNNYQNSLDKVNKQLATHSEQLKEWGTKLTDTGGKIKTVGEGLTKGITVPITGMAAASVAAWKEVDDGMDTVTAKTGASGAALEDMQNRAKAIAETIPTDFQTAGNAVGEVNTRFGSTGTELQNLSEQFIKFAEINKTDVSSSVDNVQSTLAAFGLSAKDAGNMLDTLNKVGQDTGISVDTLAQQMTSNAAAFKEMGWSASDAAKFIGNLSKSGIDSSTVMAGLKKALANATKEGIPMSTAMGDLQKQMENAGSSTKSMQVAMDLFGAKSGPAIAEACKTGRLSFDALGTSITDNAGNINKTFEEMEDPLDKLEPILNQLKDTGADIIDSAGPMIIDILKKVAAGAKELNEKWTGLSEGQKQAIEKFAVFAATAGPVITVIGGLTSGIGGFLIKLGSLPGAIAGVQTGIGILGTGIGSIGSAIPGVVTGIGGLVTAFGPFILIAAAVVAAGILIYKNWDTIKEKAGELKSGIAEKWNAIKQNTSNTFENIKNTANQKMTEMHSQVSERLGAIKAAYETHGGGIKGSAAATIESVKQYYRAGYDAINSLTRGRLGSVVSSFRSYGSEMMNSARNTFGDIRDSIGEKMDSAGERVRSAIERIRGFFNFSWSLPHFDMPHPYVYGSFSLRPPRVPTFGIDWHANGGIMTDPTAFGINPITGNTMVGGEAGAEAIAPITTLKQYVSEAVNESSQGQVIGCFNKLYELMENYLPEIAAQKNVMLNTGALVGQIAPAMDTALGHRYQDKARGMH